MVYIASDGTIHQSTPWGLSRLINLFYSAIFFVVFFFKSLVGLDNGGSSYGKSGGSGSSFRGSGGGGSSRWGGGGGGGPDSPGGGGGPKRFFTMRDINPPTIGGCPGGACGR